MKYYLKFTDQTEAESIIGERAGCDIDMIGAIYTKTGNRLTSDDGSAYDEMAPVEGYHVNLLCRDEQPDLLAYHNEPATPYRVWAE